MLGRLAKAYGRRPSELVADLPALIFDIAAYSAEAAYTADFEQKQLAPHAAMQGTAAALHAVNAHGTK